MYLTYFLIMQDFGFPGTTLIGLYEKKGVLPAQLDFYNPNSPYLGNSNLAAFTPCNTVGTSPAWTFIDWNFTT